MFGKIAIVILGSINCKDLPLFVLFDDYGEGLYIIVSKWFMAVRHIENNETTGDLLAFMILFRK